MSLQVAPSTSYEATLELGVTGLVGTLRLGTYDGDTATQALSTTDINEIGTSGVYVATRTSPDDRGQYVLIWSEDGTLDPDKVTTEDLRVTSSTGEPFDGEIYGTTTEMFRRLKIGAPGPTPTTEQTEAALGMLTTATGEINAEVDRDDDPITGWEISLATGVCIDRAIELWRVSPFGIVGIDSEAGGIHTSRNPWETFANRLAPLKRRWGMA